MSIIADNKWLVSGTPINTTLDDLKNQLAFLGIQHVPEMFAAFRDTVIEKIQGTTSRGRRRRRSYAGGAFPKAPWVGHFTFLMRSIMLRHSQAMKYRGTTTTLMSLPPKTERTLVVPFNEQDKASYLELEKEAKAFYSNFKAHHSEDVSKSYLKLTQKLLPLRTACAGGQIPLNEPDAEEGDGNVADEEEDGDDFDDDDPAPRKSKKKVQVYSKFAYTSKLNKLIEELETIRVNDPSAKSLVFSQFTSTLSWLKEELPRRGFQVCLGISF